MAFRARTDLELDRLSDADLIAYLREAHAAGDAGAARLALQILVYGYWSLVAARLDRKLPRHAVEDATGDVIVRAVQSAFSGGSIGEFRAWLSTIIDRSVVDFYRQRSRRPAEEPLEGGRGEGTEVAPVVPDGSGYVEVQMVLEVVLGELRDDHRRVVEIVVFEDRPAGDAVAEVAGMTADNVYQVVRRFRTRLREALEGDTG